ncbi:hypothetical protein [[Mycobacterium] burgundiense]|uniref:hypothetical protein n=1 Tax=[Mycobacterium] burgundiense TaxID=3064286 RepID=UPI0028046109|nr:hypothetical protein [Mycolicibacterium sp. MU0053]
MALVVVVAVLKCVSVVLAGNSAVSSFEARDPAALGSDVAVMRLLDVIEPGQAHFAAGAQAALHDRLDDADRAFSDALTHSSGERSCAARVNLVLVRETSGDRAAAVFEGASALARYLRALDVVEQAPPGCFAGNADPDLQRRAVRDDTLPRLQAKIRAVQVAPPPPPVRPTAPTAPPPAVAGGADEDDDNVRRLYPETGDPLERLEQILRDGAAAR